ncbi:unnamed protein product, partial [Mesorhabditis spiculigera]
MEYLHEFQRRGAEFWKDLNTFELYQNGSVDHGIHSGYKYSWALPFEKLENPEHVTRLLQQYWHWTIYISVVYFILIKGIQYLLTNRKPFDLKIPLVLWNGALAVFSIAGFLRFGEDLFDTMKTRPAYEWVCYSCHPKDVAAFWSLMFALSKLVELGDTLFIVLRKKPLIFLHYYHHVAVLIYTFHSGAEHTAAGRAFITMNYFAHSVMYTYYTITASGIRVPRPIAKSVTIVQTTQMLAGVAVSCFVLWVKDNTNWPCQQSRANLGLAFLIYTTFLVLFLHFYWRAYHSRPAAKSTQRPKKD